MIEDNGVNNSDSGAKSSDESKKYRSVWSKRSGRALKTDMKKIKLNNILCSVYFLVMCSVVKSTSLYYIPWQYFISFTVYCRQLATIPSSKLLVRHSLQGSNSHSSKAKMLTPSIHTYTC
jgi:hypothetical protein